MPPMDYHQFEKMIAKAGYSIGQSTKHHTIIDKNGIIVERFAIHHSKGSKKYIKPHYVNIIKRRLGLQ